jgi:hypothetical protein
MAKWADYLITAVRYNAAETHIDKVQVRQDLGDKVSTNVVEQTRQTVVANIKAKTTYATATLSKETGNWVKGAAVEIVVVNAVEYIRTDANKTAKDNLGELPRF